MWQPHVLLRDPTLCFASRDLHLPLNAPLPFPPQYRRPRLNVWQPDVLLRDLMLYFASRDLHLSATFARRFYWSDMNLWPEDMPPGSVVLLSGNDDLVHADEVKLMLEQCGSHIKVRGSGGAEAWGEPDERAARVITRCARARASVAGGV